MVRDELIVHRRIGLVAEGRLHRGWGGRYTDILYFGSFGMGVEARL